MASVVGKVAVDITNILQDVYNSELNITISWFWDEGIDVAIGDHFNGIRDEGNFDTVIEAMQWLTKRLSELYPESDFAKKWSVQND